MAVWISERILANSHERKFSNLPPRREIASIISGLAALPLGYVVYAFLPVIPLAGVVILTIAMFSVAGILWFTEKKKPASMAPEELGSNIKKWLTDYKWTVRDYPRNNTVDIFHYIVTTELGYELQVNQEKDPKNNKVNEYIGIIAVHWVTPAQKAKMDNMSKEESDRFITKFGTEMAKGGYQWVFDPLGPHPKAVISLFKGPPETVSTRADFFRETLKVLNGWIFIIGYFNTELGTQ
jgi:hypothetical protein